MTTMLRETCNSAARKRVEGSRNLFGRVPLKMASRIASSSCLRRGTADARSAGIHGTKLRAAHARCPSVMPMGETIGFQVEQIEAGSAIVAIDANRRHSNAMGATHGGLLFLLADTAAGLAYLALLPEGESGTTVEMKINFLRPVWQTRLRAEARIVQQGATLSLAECDVRDSNQRLVARATATMMRLTGRAAEGRTTVLRRKCGRWHRQRSQWWLARMLIS